MKPQNTPLPEGMQDVLPMECLHKRKAEQSMRTLFAQYGYAEVETPILEHYSAFEGARAALRSEQVFKLVDASGHLLAVRPDNTMPMARMAATRLRESALPLRLCYIQDVAAFSVRHDAGRQRLFTQAGIEFMGECSPEADAEVIALAARALLAAGLTGFQIDIGQVDFFKGLMEEAGLEEQHSEALRAYVEDKNMLAIELLLRKLALPEAVRARILALPALYGGTEVLAEAEAITAYPRCRAALDNVRAVLSMLADYGLSEYVSVDLGMVHAINYYTGIIFRGLTGELGQPILTGGRYDGLLAEYGRPMAATGFALNVKQVLIALERQGGLRAERMVDAVLGFAPEARARALAHADALREQGKRVEMAYVASREQLLRRKTDRGAACALWITRDGAQPLEEA